MTTAVNKIAHNPSELSALSKTFKRSGYVDWSHKLLGELSPEPDPVIHVGQAEPMPGYYTGFGVIDKRHFEMYEQIRMLPSAEDVETILSEVDRLGCLREFATAIMRVAVEEARRECMGLKAVQQLNGWFATMEEIAGTGVDHALVDADLAAALMSLDSVQAEAEEEGEQIPSDSVISKARAALLRIHPVAQRTYDVSGMPDGGVVIEVETPFGASFVLIVEADAGAHCLMAIGSSKVEQRKYTDEEMRELPDAFMKDALARLPRI